MLSPKCSIHLDICHVNSSEEGATHSCCCVLQCVHYSMERGDAELISMATGLNDRTRVKENLPLAAEVHVQHPPLVWRHECASCPRGHGGGCGI